MSTTRRRPDEDQQETATVVWGYVLRDHAAQRVAPEHVAAVDAETARECERVLAASHGLRHGIRWTGRYLSVAEQNDIPR